MLERRSDATFNDTAAGRGWLGGWRVASPTVAEWGKGSRARIGACASEKGEREEEQRRGALLDGGRCAK